MGSCGFTRNVELNLKFSLNILKYVNFVSISISLNIRKSFCQNAVRSLFFFSLNLLFILSLISAHTFRHIDI